jgi:hypothetical protein
VILFLVIVPNIVTMIASENDGRTSILVFEQVNIVAYLFAAFLSVDTLKSYLAKQVSGDSVDLVELGVASAEGTVVRILREPLHFAVRADGFLAHLAFQWVLEDIVANSADELWNESCNV